MTQHQLLPDPLSSCKAIWNLKLLTPSDGSPIYSRGDLQDWGEAVERLKALERSSSSWSEANVCDDVHRCAEEEESVREHAVSRDDKSGGATRKRSSSVSFFEEQFLVCGDECSSTCTNNNKLNGEDVHWVDELMDEKRRVALRNRANQLRACRPGMLRTMPTPHATAYYHMKISHTAGHPTSTPPPHGSATIKTPPPSTLKRRGHSPMATTDDCPRRPIRRANHQNRKRRIPCKFFAKGHCSRGEHCQFSHDLTASQSTHNIPCKYIMQNKPCPFKENCMYSHRIST